MQIILIKENNLRKLILPKTIEGNFWLTDIDDNGNEKNLIDIDASNGNWNLISNNDVYCIENERKIPQVAIEDYNLYTLKSKDKLHFVYSSPYTEPNYQYYDISTLNQDITIGKSSNSTISYNFSYLNDVEAKIVSNNNSVQLIPNVDSKLGIFVNDVRINFPTLLENGDYIFISGLKIIYLYQEGRMMLMINSIPGKTNNKLTSTPKIEIKNDFNKEEIFEGNIEEEENYFHKTPRFTQILTEFNLRLDPPPNPINENKMPLILVAGPMLTTSMMSLMYGYNALNTLKNNPGNPAAGIMSLVMCITMLMGTLVWPSISRQYEKKQIKEYEKIRQAKYREYLSQVREEINKELVNQENIMRSNYPNLQECQNTILKLTPELWQRRVEDRDFTTVSLGFGDLPMGLNLDYSDQRFSLAVDDLQVLALELKNEKKQLKNIPIPFSFRNNNMLGIIGDKGVSSEYIKNIILQLIAYHSYDNLKLVILTDEDNQYDWEYIRALPHLYTDDKSFRFFGTNIEEHKAILYQLDSIITQRQEMKKSEEVLYNPHFIIITDCFKAIRNFEITNKLFNGTNLGFSMIILNDKISTLPDKCQIFVSLDGDQGELYRNILNNEKQHFKVDNTQILLEECVTTLANVPIEINTTSEGQMPNKVGFLEMYNVGKIEQLNIENRWKTSNPMVSLDAPVGIGKSGEKVSIDLHEKYHGPHGLVAGMTGSGKSEFLISYILSMAVNYHPYEVQFILIDYKGGGLAGAFENQLIQMRLPHLVGTITNLDKNEIKRSLASIESELKRRQRMFNEAREISGESTIDIYKYQKMYRQGTVKEPISHLFIISDEFAELKNQEPEFMDQLISTARIGRSLGVHLILATQKPSGVVNAQIWSNTRFRVCLRVQDTGDSNEVIKCPDAAFLKQTGRFYFQVGQNELFVMGQSAYCGTQYIPSETIKKETDESINILNNCGVPVVNIEEEKKNVKAESNGEELINIVTYLSQIGKEKNIKVTPLWLPKIPEMIYIENIKKQFNYSPTQFVFNPVIGLYDDPNSQYQGMATINLTENGNTLIYGMSGSGEVLILGTLIYSLCVEHTPQEVNIYAIDCGSETLTMYKNLPHVGDVVLTLEEEKIFNLFKMIEEETERRKKLFIEYNGEYNYYCKNSGNTLPAMFIILNNYDTFKETYEDLEEKIRVLSRDCIKYGIYFIISLTNVNGLRNTIRQNFNNLLSLQLTDETAYSYIFGNIHKMTPSSLYGRGLIKLETVYEFQTAHVTDDDVLIPFIKDMSTKLYNYYKYKAKPIPILPEIVKIDEIIDENTTIKSLPVGINKDTLEVVTYNFSTPKTNMILTEIPEDIPKVFTSFGKLFSKYSKLIVIDPENLLQLNNPNFVYISDNIDESIDELINVPNDTNNYMCIILGLNEFIKKLSPSSKTKLTELFSKPATTNLRFVIMGTADMIKGQEFELWYKDNFEVKSGIYIGNGIDNQSILKIDNTYKLGKIKIDNRYAYVIKRGKTNLVKIIEE